MPTTRETRAAHTRATLRNWTARCVDYQRTPVCLIAIGHARHNLGVLQVLTPDEPQPLTRAELRALLQRLLVELDAPPY